MAKEQKQAALLALEDGRVWRGRSCGAAGETCGEMVFNTSMTGYQEVLTDPSYAGQIVCMTYPLIGNYGVNRADEESARPWVEGFVVREMSRVASNWRSEETLENYLRRWNVVALEGVDSRALVRHIRDKGAMRACLSTLDLDADSLIHKARTAPAMENRDLRSTSESTSDSLRLRRSDSCRSIGRRYRRHLHLPRDRQRYGWRGHRIQGR